MENILYYCELPSIESPSDKLIPDDKDSNVLIFTSEDRLEFISEIRSEIVASNTWGNLKSRIPFDEYEWILNVCFGEVHNHPNINDEILIEYMPCYYDDELPYWLQFEHNQVIPRNILRKYSTVSLGNHTITSDFENTIIEELNEQNYIVIKSDYLLYALL